MSSSGQTAIRGVVTAGALNLVTRLLSFGSHVAITAFFGLSGELDAYFVALTVVAVTFLVLGDGFDSVAVPALVAVHHGEGRQRFAEIGGALLALSVAISIGLGIIVMLLLPWVHLVAPGLRPEVQPLVAGNLVRLAPFALLFLPCRAVASVLRSQRRFLPAAGWEAVGAAGALVSIILLRRETFGIALSVTVGAVVGAAALCLPAGSVVRFNRAVLMRDFQKLFRVLMALLPIYGVVQLFRIADRAFASFLGEGAISAISYGQLLAVVPVGVLALENVFMVPLAETDDRGALLHRILRGIVIVSVPMAAFAAAFSSLAVAAAFERGRFDAVATEMTSEALQGFALGLPATFVWLSLYRAFQVLDRLDTLLKLVVGAFFANCVLNGVSLMLGFGVRGLAASTTLATFGLVAFGLAALRNRVGTVVGPSVIPVAVQTLLASVVGLAVAAAVPAQQSALFELALRGGSFAIAVGAIIAIAPAGGICEWRTTVARELLGALGRRPGERPEGKE